MKDHKETDAIENLDAEQNQSIYPKGSTAADLEAAFEQARKGEKILMEAPDQGDPKLPEHWSEDDKAAFKALDSKAKNWLLSRHKAMEGDYTRKTMELAKDRKKVEKLAAVDKVFEQYKDDLMASGVDEARATAELMEAYRQLRRDPKAVLQRLAQTYGVELQSSKAEELSGGNIPEWDQLKNEIGQLKAGMQQQMQQQILQSIRMGQHKINNLKEAKDETGRELYPHFESLLPEMLMLAHADVAMGKQPDLNDLYERSGWSHPTIRQEFIAAQQQSAAKQKAEQNRAKVEAAKKAGVSVYGVPATDGGSKRPARTLREELEAAFRDSLSG